MNIDTCFCIGPQNGEPLCPCRMRARGIVKRDGRWVEPEHDLGDVYDNFSQPDKGVNGKEEKNDLHT